MTKDLTKKQFERRAEELAARLRGLIADGPAGKPFDDTTPAARRMRVERARNDPDYYLQTYLPHYATDPSPPFHRELDELADTPDQIIVIAAPRGFAKTTRLITLGTLMDICYQRERFIVIGSDTEDQAALFALTARIEIEENERIRCDFGDLRGNENWQAGDYVAGGVRVKARGVGQRIRGLVWRGSRPTRARLDDIQDHETAASPTQTAKRVNWIKRSVFPGLVPSGGRLTVVGQLLHPRCVLSTLMNERDDDGAPLHISRVYRALEDGKSLWPERFPVSLLLEKRRQIGTISFESEYQNNPHDPGGMFQIQWLQFYKRGEIDVSKLLIARGTDPSLGRHDDTAILTIGYDQPAGNYYILDCVLRRIPPLETVRKLREMHLSLPARADIIETNAFQSLLADVIMREAAQLAVVRYEARINKQLRIAALSPLMENGRVWFDRSVGDTPKLIDQLLYYPSEANDDGPDCLAMTVHWLQAAQLGAEYQSVRRREWRKALESY